MKTIFKILGVASLPFILWACPPGPPGCQVPFQIVDYSNPVGNWPELLSDIFNRQQLGNKLHLAKIYFIAPIDMNALKNGTFVPVTSSNLGNPQINAANLVTFVNSSGQAVPFSTSWYFPSNGPPVLQIDPPPGGSLQNLHTDTYTIDLTTNYIRQASDKKTGEAGWKIIIRIVNPTSDHEYPYVTFIDPPQTATLVEPHTAPLTINFSEPLGTGWAIVDPDLPFNITTADLKHFEATPAKTPDINTTYTITIYSDTGAEALKRIPPAKDRNGNPLVEYPGSIIPKDFIWTITTSKVRIDQPLPSSAIAACTVDVRGVAAPDILSVTVNGITAFLPGDGTFVVYSYPLLSGSNTLIAEAVDSSGIMSRDRITVTYQPTPPVIEVTEPKNGAYLCSSPIDISGNVFATSGVNVTVNGDPATVIGTTFIRPSVPLNNEANIITVVAQDACGLTTTQGMTITLATCIDSPSGRIILAQYDARGNPGYIEWQDLSYTTHTIGHYLYHPTLNEPVSIHLERIGLGTIDFIRDYDPDCDLIDPTPPNQYPGQIVRCITEQWNNVDGTGDQYKFVLANQSDIGQANSTGEFRDSLGRRLTVAFNSQQKLLTVENALGHRSYVQYDIAQDSLGEYYLRPSAEIDPNGVVKRFDYDPAWNNLRITHKGVGPNGEDSISEYLYEGGVLVGQSQDGLETRTTQSPGLRVDTTNFLGTPVSNIEYRYDSLGNVTQMLERLFTGPVHEILHSYDSGENEIRTESYDYNGNLVGLVENTYDPQDHLTKKIEDGVITEFVYTGNNVTQLYENGQLQKTFGYDPAQRLVELDDQGFKTKWTGWNEALDESTATEYSGSGLVRYRYNFDVKGRPIYERRGDLGEMRYTMDAAGRTITAVTGDTTATYDYDVLGRTTAVRYIKPGDQETEQFFYDGANPLNMTVSNGIGELTGVMTKDMKKAISYNKSGKVSGETAEIDGERFVVGYEYDIRGNITKVTYPSGKAVSYIASIGGDSVAYGDNILLQGAEHDGRVIKGTYGNGLTIGVSLIKKLPTALEVSGVLQRSYRYDLKGNLLTESIQDPTGSETFNYTYDARSRLIHWQSDAQGRTGYSLDIFGNRVGTTHTDTAGTIQKQLSYTYIPDNKLTRIDTPQENEEQFSFDSSGRVNAHAFAGGRSRTIQYNPRGLVANISESGGVSPWDASYGYGEKNIRVMKKVHKGGFEFRTILVYDKEGRIIEEIITQKKNGTIIAKDIKDYIYYGEEPIAVSTWDPEATDVQIHPIATAVAGSTQPSAPGPMTDTALSLDIPSDPMSVPAATFTASSGSTHFSWRLTEWPVSPYRPYEIARDPDGKIWFSECDLDGFGPQATHLGRLITETGEVKIWQVPYGSRVCGLSWHEGNLWMAIRMGPYLARFDPATESFSYFTVPTGSWPFDLDFDDQGYMWFSDTGTGRVGRFDPATGQFGPFYYTGGNPAGVMVKNGVVWATQVLSGGELWKIDPVTGIAVKYTLPTPSCPHSLTSDAAGNIWLAEACSSDKMAAFNPTTATFTEYSLGSGVYGIAYRPQDKTIWASGGDRLFKLNLTQGTLSRYDVPLAGLTNLTIDPEGRIFFDEFGAGKIGMLHEELPAVYYVHSDNRMVPARATDKAGTIAWRRDIDPYGIVVREEGKSGLLPFVFKGQYQDIESGYYYNIHRYYIPQSGRYLSPDLTHLPNLYIYANANPDAYMDPTGLFSIAIAKVKAGIKVCYWDVWKWGWNCSDVSIWGQYSLTPPNHELITGLGVGLAGARKLPTQMTKVFSPMSIGIDVINLVGAKAGIYLSIDFPRKEYSVVSGSVHGDVAHGFPSNYDEAYHFDNNSFVKGYGLSNSWPMCARITYVYKKYGFFTVKVPRYSFAECADAFRLGEIVHAPQDFWAHSTAVDRDGNVRCQWGNYPDRSPKCQPSDPRQPYLTGKYDGGNLCGAIADYICGCVKPLGITVCCKGSPAHCDVNKDKVQRDTVWRTSASYTTAFRKGIDQTRGKIRDFCQRFPSACY